MDGYNFTEIGMLVGAAIGGILSVIGFMLWHSTITFSLHLQDSFGYFGRKHHG